MEHLPPGGGRCGIAGGCRSDNDVSSMSTDFTIGKEKFKQYDSQLKRILEECEKSRETLLSLMEEDIAVYSKLNSAFSLPKSNEAEKELRSEAIQNATIIAMEVPLKATMCCLYILELTREVVDIANPNLISDVGVSGFWLRQHFNARN